MDQVQLRSTGILQCNGAGLHTAQVSDGYCPINLKVTEGHGTRS